MAWIPFWAAGVINGAGHYWGYRNFPVEDASTNLVPIGILIGGEELHNNHHAFPTSAKLSSAWYEFDVGWMYIRLLEMLGLARVNRTAPAPRFGSEPRECDLRALQCIVKNRYFVLSEYTRSVRKAAQQELGRLGQHPDESGGEAIDAVSAGELERWLGLHTWDRTTHRRLTLDAGLRNAAVLKEIYSMRQELSDIWSGSSADESVEQMLDRLRDWCARAEASRIESLRQFARNLPRLV